MGGGEAEEKDFEEDRNGRRQPREKAFGASRKDTATPWATEPFEPQRFPELIEISGHKVMAPGFLQTAAAGGSIPLESPAFPIGFTPFQRLHGNIKKSMRILQSG
jgi:hypothetical protein